MPLSIPTLPVTVEPDVILATREELVGDVMSLSSALLGLYQIGTGQIHHLQRGKCPSEDAGIQLRDDECPACIELNKADERLNSCGLANPFNGNQLR